MAMNSVKAYFIRYWKREDMMSSAPLSQHARRTLKMVYLTLFSAMLAAAFGSHLHLIWEERGLIWEAWGMFIILCFVASLAYLYFTWRVTNRFMLLMAVAFCFGTSIGRLPNYFFEIDEHVFGRVFQALAIVFGCFWFSAWVCRERSQIYIGVLIETWPLMIMWFNDTQWMLKVHVLLALFIVYLMLHSQEILFHAQFGDMDYVNCAFTVFFGLPSIVVHAVYITLFCAMLTATFGSFLHLISEVGGLFTVLSSVASLCCLVYTSPWKEKKRVFLLMIAAFSFGASVGIFTKYFFGINQDFVFSSLAGTTIGFGTFWVGAWSIRRRSVYINCWLVSIILLFLWFVIAADIFGGHTARWMPWISHYCLLVYE